MKRLNTGQEPIRLTNYRNSAPQSTWQQMKDDPFFGGAEAYIDCRKSLIDHQGGICAYCEIEIRDNDPLKCRIEHFHPKSDITPLYNWALDWRNFLGVCSGGSYAYNNAPGHYLQPAAENLSCDAHKNQMIQSGKLAENCEGWILNPAQLGAFPCLFSLEMRSGKLNPNPAACAASEPPPANAHGNLEALVQYTIDVLNLNCDRLKQARLRVIWNIEHNKKKQREAGLSYQQGMTNLADLYFRLQWHAFFTTIRLCLGANAESHLGKIQFQG